jgi:enoyl-CoA hydratase
MSDMPTPAPRILYETPAPHVARLVLNRVESRNAQDTHLLYELNDAFDRAAQDDAIKVIILAANGPHFSSGHDLRETGHAQNIAAHRRVGTWCGVSCQGAEPTMSYERELYQGLCERWAALPKPTIAQVQGRCVAGGLMLVWPCDLVMAADDAQFQDNTLDMGVCGVEYFAHPWELGPRKAKELLFTSDWLSAAEAHALGMVNHVVPRAELEAATLALAQRIARKSIFTLKLAKEAVNGVMNAQGRKIAMDHAFVLHQLSHSHNMQVHGLPVDPAFFQSGPLKKPG